MSIFIKTSFCFCIVRFYSSVSQLQLRVKRVADWMRCSIIYSKIDQNSRAYFIVVKWETCDSFILYRLYRLKHVISKSHSVHCVLNKVHDFISNLFMWDSQIFRIWSSVNVSNFTDLFLLVLESVLVVSDCFWSVN